MKTKLLVISILLLIFICYYWLTQYNKSIETYVNNTIKVYIRNLNDDGTVNPILDENNLTEMRHIRTFEGHDVEVYIGEGITEINGFFNNSVFLVQRIVDDYSKQRRIGKRGHGLWENVSKDNIAHKYHPAFNLNYIPVTLDTSDTVYHPLVNMRKRITKIYFPSTLTKINENEFRNYSKLDLGNVILPPTLIDIGANAFRGTAITTVTLPGNFPMIDRKHNWNHDGDNSNNWSSIRAFAVYNVMGTTKAEEKIFKNKWVIVYNNNYYYNYENSTISIGDIVKQIENKKSSTSRPYMKKSSYGIIDINNTQKFINAPLKYTHYKKVNIIRSYTKNLYPFDDNVNISFNSNVQPTIDTEGITRITCKKFGSTVWAFCGANKHRIWGVGSEGITKAIGNCNYAYSRNKNMTCSLDPIIPHMQTIDDYITNTENIQISNIAMTTGLYKVERAGELTKQAMINTYPDYTEQSVIYIKPGVTSLGSGLFNGHTKLKTIVIPTSVLRIESSCFESCPKLENVFFYPISQLISIGNRAFANCTSIKTIHFPDSLRSIGFSAFEGCSRLQVFINPSSDLKVIAMNAFASNINTLMLPSNTHIAPLNNYNTSGNKLIDICFKATSNLVQSIPRTIQSRYITQSVIDDDAVKGSGSYLLGTDGKTIDDAKYQKLNTYNIYQNKISNKVLVSINKSRYINKYLKYRYVFFETNFNAEEIPSDNIDYKDDSHEWNYQGYVNHFEVYNETGTRISHTSSPDINFSSEYTKDMKSTNINNGNINDDWVSAVNATVKNVFGKTSGSISKGFIGYDFKSPQNINKIVLTGLYTAGLIYDRILNSRGYKLYFTNNVKTVSTKKCVDPDKHYFAINSYDYGNTKKNVKSNKSWLAYLPTYTHDIPNTNNQVIQDSNHFLTVPFPIDYYRTFDTSSDIITNQSANIQTRIQTIENAKKAIVYNINIAQDAYDTIDKDGLINSMRNATNIVDLPSLEQFNMIIKKVETQLSTATENLEFIINETNKQIYADKITTLTTQQEVIKTEIEQTLRENTLRIQNRLLHEKTLDDAEVTRKIDMNTLMIDSAGQGTTKTNEWFNQYKIDNNIDTLQGNVDVLETNIKIHTDDVNTNDELIGWKTKLNDLEEVYDQVDDQKRSNYLEKKQYNSQLTDVKNEQVSRENELLEREKEKEKIVQENQNIKSQVFDNTITKYVDMVEMDLQYTTDKMNEQTQHTKNMIQLNQQKNTKTQLFDRITNDTEKILEQQQQVIEDNINKQKQYEPFMNLNKYNLKYMDPKFEDYKLNQEDCNHLLTTFDNDLCEDEYYNNNKTKCIQKEICENRNRNNQLENEIYIKPGTKKRLKDSKENYNYNYSNTVHMSLGILTLLTIIYKIK